MSRTAFQTEWCEIAARWKLSIEAPYEVKLSSGSITVPVLLRDFGAPKGMLLVTDYETIAPYAKELVALGFGYSCLSASRGSYNPAVDDESIRTMLEDWGWSGASEPPQWLEHQSS